MDSPDGFPSDPSLKMHHSALSFFFCITYGICYPGVKMKAPIRCQRHTIGADDAARVFYCIMSMDKYNGIYCFVKRGYRNPIFLDIRQRPAMLVGFLQIILLPYCIYSKVVPY